MNPKLAGIIHNYLVALCIAKIRKSSNPSKREKKEIAKNTILDFIANSGLCQSIELKVAMIDIIMNHDKLKQPKLTPQQNKLMTEIENLLKLKYHFEVKIKANILEQKIKKIVPIKEQIPLLECLSVATESFFLWTHQYPINNNQPDNPTVKKDRGNIWGSIWDVGKQDLIGAGLGALTGSPIGVGGVAAYFSIDKALDDYEASVDEEYESYDEE